MAQIIQFPVKTQAVSNGYGNLSRLIAVAATKDVLNFYIESIEHLEKSGNLLDGEAQKLTEQGREKRLEMAKPDPIEKKLLRLLEYTAIHQKWEARNQIVRWRHPKDITESTGSLIRHWKSRGEELSL